MRRHHLFQENLKHGFPQVFGGALTMTAPPPQRYTAPAGVAVAGSGRSRAFAQVRIPPPRSIDRSWSTAPCTLPQRRATAAPPPHMTGSGPPQARSGRIQHAPPAPNRIGAKSAAGRHVAQARGEHHHPAPHRAPPPDPQPKPADPRRPRSTGRQRSGESPVRGRPAAGSRKRTHPHRPRPPRSKK